MSFRRTSLHKLIVAVVLVLVMFVAVQPTATNAAVSSTVAVNMAGSPTANGRIFRDGVPSTCAGKAYPGLFNAGTQLAYHTEVIVNNTGVSQCVSVQLVIACGTSVHLLAYRGSFDPANQGANYIGDIGSSVAGVPMQFTLGAGETAIIVFQEVNFGAAASCTNVVASATPLGFGLPDEEVESPVTFFNPLDGRVDPRPGDRVAAYCRSDADGNRYVYVIVIGPEGKAQGEVVFDLDALLTRGEAGQTKSPSSHSEENVGKMGNVSLSAQEFDGVYHFYLAWNGGAYNASGVGDFSKGWTSASPTCAFSTEAITAGAAD